MKPISFNKKTEDTERLLCPGSPQGPAHFHELSPSLPVSQILNFPLCPCNLIFYLSWFSDSGSTGSLTESTGKENNY